MKTILMQLIGTLIILANCLNIQDGYIVYLLMLFYYVQDHISIIKLKENDLVKIGFPMLTVAHF